MLVIVEILLVSILAVLLLLVYEIVFKPKKIAVPPEIDHMVTDYGRKHDGVMTTLGELRKTIEDRLRESGEAQKTYQEKVENSMSGITRTLSGTKRGGMGEAVLKEILASPISTGLVVTDLDIGTKRVEFAWNIGYGKYIPIDAKFPEVEDLYGRFVKSENIEEQKRIKTEIRKKLKHQVEKVRNYNKRDNTIDKCILTIPDGLMELLPEMGSEIERSSVVVCGYNTVFFHAFLLADSYRRTQEKGDIGHLEQALLELQELMKEVSDSCTTIERGLKQIENANKEIEKKVIQSERYGRGAVEAAMKKQD